MTENQFMKTKLIIKPVIAGMLLLALTSGTARATETKELWDKNCASCHGKDGKGDTKMGKKVDVKDYTDPKFQAEYKEEKGIKAIKEGITEKGKERMKAYTEKFSDEEIKALAAHVRTFKQP